MVSDFWLILSEINSLKDELVSSPVVVTFLVTLIVITWFKFLIKPSKNNTPPLPPGPRGLPLVGNLLFLDRNLHRCLAELSKIYGPIMKIRLGTRLCIVVSSHTVAKEIFKDHDAIFANRDVPAAAVPASYGVANIVWSPHGDHLTMLRKICVRELLSNVRLDSLYSLRRSEVRNMVTTIYSKIGEPVNIVEQVLSTMFGVMTNMMWGGTLDGKEKERADFEFKQIIDTILRLVGQPNVSDFWPILGMFDLQGAERGVKKVMSQFDQIFDPIIAQKRKGKLDGKNKDFLQVLLELLEYGDQKLPFTTTHIKAIFLDIVSAGTKSSSTTVEWAMAQLMKQPDIIRKAKEEIEMVVGINNIVEESHLPKLHYIDAVVKETLRLHPVGPLLIPRRPSESCVIGGYMVPKGCKVMVNTWAIHRDPDSWENPLEFCPERFLGAPGEWDYTGNTFSYVPFGAGRRICVGICMAERMVQYLLSTLLHSFDWKLSEKTGLDLSETFGLETKKTTPLVAIPSPRLSDPKLYT